MPDSTDLPVNPPADDVAPAAASAAEASTPDTPDPLAEAAAAQQPATEQSSDAPAATEVDGDAGADADAETLISATPATPGAPNPPALSPAAAADLLRQHFPALFAGPAKPFKLRIQQDIQQRAPGVFSKATLSAYFRRHTGSTGYLLALSKATHRFDLDGQPAGELSEEHKQLAQAELLRRRQLTREREQLAQTQQRAQQQEAQRAEMAQQAEAMQARQARAALLRDFHRTTLTLANFCALKGMAPDALTPLLEQAKKEAAEAPPVAPRAFDERRGPGGPGPRRDDRPGQRPDQRPSQRPDQRPDQRQDARGPTDRPDARGPRHDDRRPARPGAAPGNRGPRGPAGQS